MAELGVGELVLCGVNTHVCIRMAAVDAYQRGFPGDPGRRMRRLLRRRARAPPCIT
ncbi:MAG: isochorismatase family protein [Mesorhizobium sp.]|nr:MAG: isochorismatase family protein [Mesorhizobium sp.]